MVQKEESEPRRRGRPRAYDPEAALQQALEAFWRTGYSGTSLDDISAATGMNRPSLYAAFGDKHALYMKALAQYWRLALDAMRRGLDDADRPLKDALKGVYDEQLAIYFSGDGRPRGCFAVGTATTESVADAEIRHSLAEGLRLLDADLEARLVQAQARGELKRDVDPAALAVLAAATLHTIAIRARAGVDRTALEDLAAKAVKVICG